MFLPRGYERREATQTSHKYHYWEVLEKEGGGI
jgi:hypothetical protein